MSREQRRKPRHRCNFDVEARASDWRCRARVIDISESGLCIQTDKIMDLQAGEIIEIYSEQLGYMTGKARWRRFERIGIEFRPSTDTKAKLEAFQRYYLWTLAT